MFLFLLLLTMIWQTNRMNARKVSDVKTNAEWQNWRFTNFPVEGACADMFHRTWRIRSMWEVRSNGICPIVMEIWIAQAMRNPFWMPSSILLIHWANDVWFDACSLNRVRELESSWNIKDSTYLLICLSSTLWWIAANYHWYKNICLWLDNKGMLQTKTFECDSTCNVPR